MDDPEGGLPPERWEEIEAWLPRAVEQFAHQWELPPSLAATYHGGELSAILQTPAAVVEDLDRVERVLRRFLPRLLPDQVLVLWPAAYTDRGTLFAAHAHLGEAAGNRWRTLVSFFPVPERDITAEPFALDPPNPYARRLRRMFRGPVAGNGLVRVPPAHGFALYLRPGGPLDGQLEPVGQLPPPNRGPFSGACGRGRVRLR